MPSAIIRTKKPKTTKVVTNLTEEDLIPPNRSYLVLTVAKMTATYTTSSGKNSTLTMESISDTQFRVTEGDTGVRWNNKKKIRTYPMEMWDSFYARHLLNGWLLYDTEKRERKVINNSGSKSQLFNGKSYAVIKDEYAAEIVERLIGFANQMIEEEYSKTIADVPKRAFEEAEKCLDSLALHYEKMSNQDFNQVLIHLFAILPRRIDILAKYIASDTATASERAEIIQTERDRLDVLKSMLNGTVNMDLSDKTTILEAYGLTIRAFTKDELKFVKEKLGGNASKFLRGWRIENLNTEKEFVRFCTEENLTEEKGIDFLFHGSRHENWWSILTNGLTINPIGVVITGKAYGHGTYFAPDAIKSLGYTSVAGAKYASDGKSSGFMAIYKVATGNRYNGNQGCDSSLNWDRLQAIQPGAHCTWAECRYSGFMMDEVIVYKNEQSTIWGLMELKM